MLVRATIEVLFDSDDAGDASEAVADTMRPLLRQFSGPSAPFIDWRYAPDGDPAPLDEPGFGYAVQLPENVVPLHKR